MALLSWYRRRRTADSAALLVPVDRNPTHAAPDRYPRLRVLEGDTTVLADGATGVDTSTTVGIECQVAGARGPDVGAALSVLYARVWKHLAADRTLDGACEHLRELSARVQLGRTRFTLGTGSLMLHCALEAFIPTGVLLTAGREALFRALVAYLSLPLPGVTALARRERVYRAVLARLQPGLPDAYVTRNPLRPDQLDRHQRFAALLDGNHDADDGVTGGTHYDLDVPIELYAAGATMGEASDRVNFLADEARVALRADAELGGVVDDLEEITGEGAIPPLEAHGPTTALALTYRARFSTDSDDVTKASDEDLAA